MQADKRYPMRKSNFVKEWMDMTPALPVPKIGWIEKKILDMPYGDDKLQKIDLYYPNEKKEGTYPLIIIIHGGGFSHMDKRDWHLYPGFFGLERGFAVASVNYRLAPKNRFPAGALDAENAIAFLKSRAEELRLDPKNFFLVGTSAGGNFVSLCGLKAEGDEKKDFKVNAVAALCPVIDLYNIRANVSSPIIRVGMFALLLQYIGRDKKSLRMLDEFLGETKEKPSFDGVSNAAYLDEKPSDEAFNAVDTHSDEKNFEKPSDGAVDIHFNEKNLKKPSFFDLARAASANSYFKGKSPAFYLLHGGKDPFVPPAQSENFYSFLKEKAGLKDEDLVVKIMENGLHAGAGIHYFERENILPIIDFFERHLK
jgi:acetyl esterase/lipase